MDSMDGKDPRLVGIPREKDIIDTPEEAVYSLQVRCRNCHDRGYRSIRKGTTFERWAEWAICINCGCREVYERY